jgi:tRNA dimethylallyltransferase
LAGLLAALREQSPDGFGRLDTQNPRRVQRALERSLASGKSLPQLQAEFAARPEPFADCDKRLILLERERDALAERVAHRAALMLEEGLIEEVAGLIDAGIRHNPSAASAIGYRETMAFLEGRLSRRDLLPAIIQNTLHLVKKQRTWFRTQIPKPDELRRLDAVAD